MRPLESMAMARGKRKTPRKPLVPIVVALAVLSLIGWLVAGRRQRPPDVLLVTIDTLRADRVGAYGYAKAETPTLDGLAARGVRVERVQSAAPVTGPSHATILTGQYPPVHGVRDNVTFPLGPEHPTLASLFQSAGYRTAAFVGGYPLAGDFGFARGFDHYDDAFSATLPGGAGAERPANEVIGAALAWLEQWTDERPRYLIWVHLYDPHDPYSPPPPYRERFRERPYDGEIAFSDAQLGRLLAKIAASPRGDDTVVAVVSDHGEGLGEHGELTHAVLAYESTLRVPLILAGPGIRAGVVVPGPVGTVDILPTLLALAGIEAPAGLPGRDLRPALDGRPLRAAKLYAESLFSRLNYRWSTLRTWTDGGYKLIEGAAPELYDLEQDPGERIDLAAERPGHLASLRADLASALERMAPGGDSAHAARLTPEQEERLRSLGYAGGGSATTLDEPGLPDPRERVVLYARLQAIATARGPALYPAISEARDIVRVDPGNPYAHFALARLAYAAGEFALARDAFARSIELDPDQPARREVLGRLLRDLGHFVDSERELRIALGQTTHGDQRTRLALAETLVDLRRLDEAEDFVREVLARDPQNVDALSAQGRILIARGDGQAGIALLDRVARRNSGADVDAWIALARGHLSLGNAGEARGAAEQALARNAAHPWAMTLRGHALVLEGRRATGLDSLRRAFRAGPRRPVVWHDLAEGFETAGDSATASLCRQRADEIGTVT